MYHVVVPFEILPTMSRDCAGQLLEFRSFRPKCVSLGKGSPDLKVVSPGPTFIVRQKYFYVI